MLAYAFPMLLAGLGGMVNETFDRLMLGWWLPGNNEYVDEQRGIYNACYKLAILITLFIQAFRMGAEPFFFKQASQADAPKTYARVMKWFVLVISCMFLVVSLYIPVWKYFIAPKEWEGLGVVPVLLLANMALGIYYNLSVWYKITNKTMAGAWITLIGTAITVIVNRLFIPYFSYYACAWATFACYTTMMVVSYTWGQKNYYIPYATKKLIAYITIAIVLFFLHVLLSKINDSLLWHLTTATLLLLAYVIFIVKTEKKEFQQLPFIGRWIK
jgi:O-antigen/teichoic acid export membrane protein